MPEIYLFTWNLNRKRAAHDLAVEHLAQRGAHDLFIACVQEIPGGSDIARARTGTPVPALTAQGIAVVSKFSRGVRDRDVPTGLAFASYPAIAHHPGLELLDAFTDEDGEFVAACFQLRAPKKTIAVVGLHAKSQVDMKDDEDRGGSRALLRHAINEIPWRRDHTIVLGDWNSELSAREMQSWHCCYALRDGFEPLHDPPYPRRRGFDHLPLHIVEPRNAATGTFRFKDSGARSGRTVDFIAVDRSLYPRSRSEILATVGTKSIWGATLDEPVVSDHLPVEGRLQV